MASTDLGNVLVEMKLGAKPSSTAVAYTIANPVSASARAYFRLQRHHVNSAHAQVPFTFRLRTLSDCARGVSAAGAKGCLSRLVQR